jgi:RNA polymerase sigma-70 factor (ECF subfamily)
MSTSVQAAQSLDLPLAGQAVPSPAPDPHKEVLVLFDACAPSLRRYVRSCGIAPEVADDIVQEAFIALFRHLRGGGGRENLRGWLMRVSSRMALKHRERTTKRRRLEESWDPPGIARLADSAAGPENRMVESERQRRLRAVFRALPERDRQCLLLRAKGLRYRDIAAALGVSLGTVAKSIARAVGRLSTADR